MGCDLTLAVMAAGVGSRYGGLKQIDRFGQSGEILMEYGIYDALNAGFDRVAVILKDENYKDFLEVAGDRLAKQIKIDYAFQRNTDVPDWFRMPQGRVKPWGTAQAIAALDGIVEGPFCVINADDFYGAQSYLLVADFLKNAPHDAPYQCCMAGYDVANTLSENGTVTRGVCDVSGTRLTRLVERYKIARRADATIFDEASGEEIPEKTSVSMNMFGFQKQIPALLKERFGSWLSTGDLIKGEYLLPSEVSQMVQEDLISVTVIPTTAQWYGVTYQEDKAPLVAEIKAMISAGVYPASLWN